MTAPTLEHARPEHIGLSPQRLDKLGEVFRDEIARARAPGAVVLVSRRGKVGYFEAFGRRDPAAQDAMTDNEMKRDAIFRIYSMTKPIVSVAVMMLVEDGRIQLADPVSKYLPQLTNLKVAVEAVGVTRFVPAASEITVQDLLRHTSGLTYEFRGTGAVPKAYMDAKIYRLSQTNADQVATLAGMPLTAQPGTAFHYGRSTDVLGRLIEVLADQTLGEFLRERILVPLDMHDTAFHVPAHNHHRLAEAFATDPDSGAKTTLLPVLKAPSFESGGGGMVSTTMDYARFLHMLANGGSLGGVRLLGRKTVELMTADHLGTITGAPDMLLPGYGFGLGFAVRTSTGLAATPGSVGQYYWGGMGGTTFWVDPAEQLIAVLMMQAPLQREYYRALMRNMVYAAISD
jgi:CubicO group peptidase (beta-lactamase class C family)